MGVTGDRLLVVDDEPLIRFGIREYFESRGMEVEEAATLVAARSILARTEIDAVILDYRLPDGDALELLAEIHERDPEVGVVVLTGHASIDLAVQAIKLGAENFLTKPVELQALAVILDRAAENRRLRRRQRVGQRQISDAPDPFVGVSRIMRELRREAEVALGADSPLLILGPTGAGKGVLARWLHEHGSRSREPMVDLNCAGLSKELVESELFGHARGAFTGAVQEKRGLFELAHRGTLFLDEIGDLDPAVQPKLLKALEERRFRRLGELVERRVDVRLVAATNADLAAKVDAGTFRADLYYRVNNLVLEIPSLAERSDDIPYIADKILAELGANRGRQYELDAGALASLQSYAWPGNVRELKSALEQAAMRAGGESGRQAGRQTIRREHLRFVPGPGRRIAPKSEATTLEQGEREQIERALKASRGRVIAAAAALGIPRSSLYQKLKDHGIDLEPFQA